MTYKHLFQPKRRHTCVQFISKIGKVSNGILSRVAFFFVDVFLELPVEKKEN